MVIFNQFNKEVKKMDGLVDLIALALVAWVILRMALAVASFLAQLLFWIVVAAVAISVLQ